MFCNLFPLLSLQSYLGILCALWDILVTVVLHKWLLVTALLSHDLPVLIKIAFCFWFMSLTCIVMAAALLSPTCMTYFFICISLNSSCIVCPPPSVFWRWMLCIWFNICVPLPLFATFIFIQNIWNVMLVSFWMVQKSCDTMVLYVCVNDMCN